MPASFTVGLVNINNSFSGQNYLPYSIGLLQAYTERHLADPSRFRFLPFIYRRENISEIVEKLKDADILGFSTYVWNHQISLEIARRLKKINPDILVIFGGPHVPDQAEEFLRENSIVDLVVHNEGEKPFLRILEAFPSGDLKDIEGISFLEADGSFINIPNGPRFRDLDEVPSPFLNGIFVSLMAANPDEKWIGMWETNRGCPFKCTFCDWGSAIAAKVNKFGMDRLKAEIDWFANKKIEFLFCCDANFGIQKRDVEIAEYIAEVKNKTGYPHRLSVQNTKNATDRAYLTQKILSDAGMNQGVTLSMQSVDEVTLENVKRQNISLDSYFELQSRFTGDKVETYSDLILGLPGETYDSFANGVDMLVRKGQHNRIQFNILTVLPNSEMGNKNYQEKYGMVTVEGEIINLHGQRMELDDDVAEVQDLVIATASLPYEDWRKMRVFGWMTALLHFDKLFQIPLIMAHELADLSYREMIEAFLNVDGSDYPIIGEIRDFFFEKAAAMQKGGHEYVYSEEWLEIFWPIDEYIFISLTAENKLVKFYSEAAELLDAFIAGRAEKHVREALSDAIRLNQALVKQPMVSDDISVETSYDIMAFYNAVRKGEKPSLLEKSTSNVIERSGKVYNDFASWCREVVWWGNKKGAYLYTNNAYVKELAGHY